MNEVVMIQPGFQMLLAIFSQSANWMPMDATVYAMFALISFVSRNLDVPEWKVFTLFAVIKAWFGYH